MKLVLQVETPKEAGERISYEHDPKHFLTPWLARLHLAKTIEKELKARDSAILGNVKEYIGGSNND